MYPDLVAFVESILGNNIINDTTRYKLYAKQDQTINALPSIISNKDMHFYDNYL